jgi:hypothetical protein
LDVSPDAGSGQQCDLKGKTMAEATDIEWLERTLASYFSTNRMPEMSGDMRKRLTPHARRNVEECAKAIAEHFERQDNND